MSIDRRSFLKLCGTGSAGLALSRLAFPLSQAGTPVRLEQVPVYQDWKDIYRNKWTWDKIVHSTHGCNCNNNCSWKVYVREGIVWREEQTAGYIQHNKGLADFNPQGCQKGASYSHEMYRSGRLRYPLKRVGERGSRQWKRVSWDEAATDIARKIIAAVRDQGSDSVVASIATHAVQPTKGGTAKLRFMDLLGGTLLDPYGDIGDGQTGTIMTTGVQSFAASADTQMLSKCIINWVFNPAYTRIPDAHFQWEARYRGATVIGISPDLNASNMHSDFWLSPKPGTDTAIALAMAHIIVRDDHLDKEHIREQTDLPFLIRDDNKKFLRASDITPGASNEAFYIWDETSSALQLAPGTMGSEVKSLDLGNMRPALEGEWEVTLVDGMLVRVRPSFEHLKKHLERHTPEMAHEVTGVGAKAIEDIARIYATSKPALINIGWGLPRLYHGDTLARAIILMSALTGNTGKVGGGFWSGGISSVEGFDYLSFPALIKTGKHRVVPAPAWMYVHAGLGEVATRWVPDDVSGRSAHDYVTESIDKDWMPVFPRKGKEPRVLIECGSNILRRTRSGHILKETLWPKLDLVLTIDYRMSSTALESDYVLPAAGYYEMEGVKLSEQKVPHHVHIGKAVQPFGESKDEWSIFAQIARKISELAPELDLDEVFDEHCNYSRDYTRLYDDFTEQGVLTEDTPDEVFVQRILDTSECYEGITLQELRDKGFADWTNSGGRNKPASMSTFEWDLDKPNAAASDFTELKRPWFSLTGRQQFYIDHDWFMAYDEAYPTYHEVPQVGGNYPLSITGGHARWSIHSLWRDNHLMLRLQRGEPIIYMNPVDAKARGIEDHEMVRIFNDIGDFDSRVMITPTMQPGQVHYYHAWERFQFKGNKSLNDVLSPQMKPITMVGDYGHLKYTPLHFQPNNTDRGTRVDVEKVPS